LADARSNDGSVGRSGEKVLKERRSPRERGRMGTSVARTVRMMKMVARRRRAAASSPASAAAAAPRADDRVSLFGSEVQEEVRAHAPARVRASRAGRGLRRRERVLVATRAGRARSPSRDVVRGAHRRVRADVAAAAAARRLRARVAASAALPSPAPSPPSSARVIARIAVARRSRGWNERRRVQVQPAHAGRLPRGRRHRGRRRRRVVRHIVRPRPPRARAAVGMVDAATRRCSEFHFFCFLKGSGERLHCCRR